MGIFRAHTHIVIAIVIGLLIINSKYMVPGINPLFFLILVSIGSILPDADYKFTCIGKIIPLWIKYPHRTITHSAIMLFAPLIISLLLGLYHIGFGLFIGIFTHVISDGLTPMGCPLWYPFNKERYNLANVKTGSLYELIIFGFCCIAIEILVIKRYLLPQ